MRKIFFPVAAVVLIAARKNNETKGISFKSIDVKYPVTICGYYAGKK